MKTILLIACILSIICLNTHAQDEIQKIGKNIYMQTLGKEKLIIIRNTGDTLDNFDYTSGACNVKLTKKCYEKCRNIVSNNITTSHIHNIKRPTDYHMIITIYSNPEGEIKDIFLKSALDDILTLPIIEKIGKDLKNKKRFNLEFNKNDCSAEYLVTHISIRIMLNTNYLPNESQNTMNSPGRHNSTPHPQF